MPLSLRWVGPEAYDAVAMTRLHSYSGGERDFQSHRDRLDRDPRGKPGDYLLAERDGLAVGTVTSLSLQMWMRGARFACQGIAFVGTVKTHRRVGSSGERGIASQMMDESLRLARERSQPITALMPFRATFYEHFGYGFAEKRTEWTVPLSILPNGSFDGMRFFQPGDQEELSKCRQRSVEAGQCDIERDTDGWKFQHGLAEPGLEVIDRAKSSGPVHSYMTFSEFKENNKSWLRVNDMCHNSDEALVRQLRFLGSLKDQYSYAIITLPGDVPLNRLLREPQIAHRPVEHAVAVSRPYTRMQIRILDHKKVLEAMHLGGSHKGTATVAVKECEGTTSRLKLDLSDGRCSVSNAAGNADVECPDSVWSSIVAGDISATEAARYGLLNASNQKALATLDRFADGPVPYSNEYF